MSDRKKVAVIVTEYRFNAHADVILGRLLGDFDYTPQVDVVSLYTDQVPHNDMSREMAGKRGVPIYPTIAETIRAPQAGGPIDGVIIIGEHGDYPTNEKRQKMYPRCRLLRETIEALDELGLNVPIFSDKHLSYSLEECEWMYAQLKQRNIPFMAGSSIPHTPPAPAYDPALLRSAREWLVVSYSTSVEAYGYHALELLQSIAEKREGGETGVRSVRSLEGDDVWAAMDRGEWPEDLMQAALSAFGNLPDGHPREHGQDPILFMVEYADGCRGYVIQLKNFVNQWLYAFRGGDKVTAALCLGDTKRPFSHFERLTKMIEAFIISRREPFPSERVLMSSGLTAYAMESLYVREPVETPLLLHLAYSGGEAVVRKIPVSTAVKSGANVYVSGQGGIDPQTKRVAGPDLPTQLEFTMRNLERALAKAGLTLGDVVQATVYLSERSLYAPFNELYSRYFTERFPARTVVYCDLNYDLLVEIDVIASTDQERTYY